MARSRLDQELVRRGFFDTRNSARNAVRDGYVSVDGVLASKPALRVDARSSIEVDAETAGYVGRGAHKLLAALDAFGVDVAGAEAVDVGASTGGFTQVLLERGAPAVVAVDVGSDQLHPLLRDDPRVDNWERTSVRGIDVGALGGPFRVVTVDLSFISLRSVVADLERLGLPDADWIVLFKPQFEVGPDGLAKDGVVRSIARRQTALDQVLDAFAESGLVLVAATESPIRGGSGNVEALLRFRRTGSPMTRDEAFKVLAHE